MAITILLAAPCAPVCQSPSSGAISGRLTDLYSRPLDGVALTLRDNATHAEAQTTTGKNGAYRFNQLPPGEYVLEATSPRDGHAVLHGITIVAGYEAHVRLALTFDGKPLRAKLDPGVPPAQPEASAGMPRATRSEDATTESARAPSILSAVIHTSTGAVPPLPAPALEEQLESRLIEAVTVPPRERLEAPEDSAARRESHVPDPPTPLSADAGNSEPLASVDSAGLLSASLTARIAFPFSANAFKGGGASLALVAAAAAQIALGSSPAEIVQNRTSNSPIKLPAASMSSTLSAEQLQEMPIAGRAWAQIAFDANAHPPDQGDDSAQIAPANRNTVAISVDGMPTESAFGANASERRSRSWMDSAGANETSIQEMKSSPSAFVLDGASSGGDVLQIETNHGTNSWHGQVFMFARQNLWGARNPFTAWVKETAAASSTAVPTFASVPYSPADHQANWGVGLGSALRHNRLFWFAAFDGSERNNPAVSMVRHPDEFFARPSNDELQVLSARLGLGGPSPVAASLAAYSSELEALTSLLGPAARTSKQWLGFARLDWQAAERHRFTFEANSTDFSAMGGGLTRSSEHHGNHSLGNVHARDERFMTRWEAFITPNLLTSTQASFARNVFQRPAEAPSAFEQKLNVSAWGQLPEMVIDSRYGFTIGNPSRFGAGNYPDEHVYQAQETLDWVRGPWLLKGGMDFRHSADATSMLRNHTGTYHYTHVENFISDSLVFSKFGLGDALDPMNQHNCDQRGQAWRDSTGQLHGVGYLPCYSYYTQTLGPTDWHLSTNDWASFVTAQWQPAKRFVLSSAFRWERQLLPPPIDLIRNPDLPLTQKLPALGNQWGPRIALAWGTHESRWPTLSAGYGMYFSHTRNSTLETSLTQTGSLKGDLKFFMRPTDNVPNLGGGAPPFPYVLSGPPAQVVKPAAVAFDPRFRNGEVHQAVTAIEQNLPGHVSISVSAVLSLARHLPVTVDTNIDPSVNPRIITYAVIDPSGKGPIKTPQITVPFYASWPTMVGGNGRANTNYQQITQVFSEANSTYEALVLHLTRSTRRGLSFRARYTYAEAADWNPNESDAISGSSVLDPAHLAEELGTSDLDVRHAVSAMFTWNSPWKLRSAGGWLANGWRLSGLGQFHSGLPYTMQTAGAIPKEFARNGAMILGLGPSINGYGGDNRLYGVGRNTYRYPDTWKADVRLARRFALGHDREIEALAESFNLFNHQNITQLETIGYFIEPGSQSGAMPTLHFLTGNNGQGEFGEPLGINGTDYYRPRQFDFGMRLRF